MTAPSLTPADLFAWPEALPALLLVPLAWLLLLLADRGRARRLARIVGPRPAVQLADLDPRRRRLRRRLLAGGLLLAILAAVQPLMGEGGGRAPQRGVDILICVDVSRSMLARDLAPSRLENARREIRALAERARGDRMGLLVFAGEARLLVPLTQDLDSFAELAAQADTVSVGRGGTDLGAALERALEALAGASGEHEVVLLLTDGEDLEQRGLRAADLCRARGITVHCIAFGSAMGSKIAITGEGGEEFLRDRAGNEVVSVMDPASLRAIASVTGGQFVDAGARPRPLLGLYEQRIQPMARKALAAEARLQHGNRFQWPLLLAFVLWMLELCMSDRRRP